MTTPLLKDLSLAIQHGDRDAAMELTVRSARTEVDARGQREHIKVIVGGAPRSEALAREIGADAYASDATSAVACVRGLDQEVS